MPRVVLGGKEAEALIKALPLESMPRFLNMKSEYMRWAAKKRLEDKDCSMGTFLKSDHTGNNFHVV